MDNPQATGIRRFASVRAVAHRAWLTLARFPFVLLAAFAAGAVAHRLAAIDFEAELGADALGAALLICMLGIPLFLALRLLGESRGWSRRSQLAASLAGLAALTAYYLVLPVPLKGADVTTYLLLFGGLALWLAFLPFPSKQTSENGFWQYNKTLFLRFATAALFSAVLYVGLALAIAACEALLDLAVEDETYAQLWFWIVFLYTTWFFLAGIPEDVRALETVRDYPAALRVFTQYVLIPLVVVYLVILYAYMAKIIIEWDLPKGWVGYPVIGVSVTGVLALLLVHPIRERAESAWIVRYAKLFHWALFPLIGLIAVAIGTRISEYGITEKRYLVVVASAWLFGIALYFTFGRRKDIRLIPLSLCLVTFLSAFGPWGATAVSRQSQLARLRALLLQEEVLVDGALARARKRIEFEAEKEINNILSYLESNHSLEPIRAWYAEPERLPAELDVELAVEGMGLRYIAPWERRPEGFAFDASLPNPLPVEGFDYAYRLSEYAGDDSLQVSAVFDDTTALYLDGTLLQLGSPFDTAGRLRLELAPTLLSLSERERDGESLGTERLEAENATYRLVLYLGSVSGSGAGDTLKISNITAAALVDRK